MDFLKNSKFLPVGESAIRHNARMLRFAHGVEIMISSRPIFRDSGWEAREKPGKRREKPVENPVDKAASLDRSRRRARAAVRALALSNDFKYFVTLTLDKERVDRYDVAAVTKKLNNWLDNSVRRKGLAYILVPELHKDGAVHFHGFFNDALQAVNSGHKDERGHAVYNLPEWTLGFTSAIELYGDYEAAVTYTCKYISKSADKVGGRWYYSGGALQQPEVLLFDAGVPVELAPGDGTGAGALVLNEAAMAAQYGPPVRTFEVPEIEAKFWIFRPENMQHFGMQGKEST